MCINTNLSQDVLSSLAQPYLQSSTSRRFSPGKFVSMTWSPAEKNWCYQVNGTGHAVKFQIHRSFMATPRPQTTDGGAGFEIERSGFEPVLVPRAFASFGHMVAGETARNNILNEYGFEPWQGLLRVLMPNTLLSKFLPLLMQEYNWRVTGELMKCQRRGNALSCWNSIPSRGEELLGKVTQRTSI